MFVQYSGFDSAVHSRIYTFHVIDPPRETRVFTIKIRSEDFGADRLKFQDGPGICSARLQRDLMGETPESRLEADLRIDDQDVREYRAQHYPQKKLPKATHVLPNSPSGSSPPPLHIQNRGYYPPGLTRHPVSEEITALLLHGLGDSLDTVRLALEAQSVRVCSLQSCQEAFPLLTGPNPPHLVFAQPKLPDGMWADVVSLALKARKPVNVIVVARLANVGLYLQTITGGAFDFILPPLTSYELTHVVRCAIENVLSRREAQARSAA